MPNSHVKANRSYRLSLQNQNLLGFGLTTVVSRRSHGRHGTNYSVAGCYKLGPHRFLIDSGFYDARRRYVRVMNFFRSL